MPDTKKVAILISGSLAIALSVGLLAMRQGHALPGLLLLLGIAVGLIVSLDVAALTTAELSRFVRSKETSRTRDRPLKWALRHAFTHAAFLAVGIGLVQLLVESLKWCSPFVAEAFKWLRDSLIELKAPAWIAEITDSLGRLVAGLIQEADFFAALIGLALWFGLYRGKLQPFSRSYAGPPSSGISAGIREWQARGIDACLHGFGLARLLRGKQPDENREQDRERRLETARHCVSVALDMWFLTPMLRALLRGLGSDMTLGEEVLLGLAFCLLIFFVVALATYSVSTLGVAAMEKSTDRRGIEMLACMTVMMTLFEPLSSGVFAATTLLDRVWPPIQLAIVGNAAANATALQLNDAIGPLSFVVSLVFFGLLSLRLDFNRLWAIRFAEQRENQIRTNELMDGDPTFTDALRREHAADAFARHGDISVDTDHRRARRCEQSHSDEVTWADFQEAARTQTNWDRESRLFLVGSALIATIGVMAAGGTTAVFGAMLAAPLGGPIYGMAYAGVTRNYRQVARGVASVFAGALLVVAIGWSITASFSGSPLNDEAKTRYDWHSWETTFLVAAVSAVLLSLATSPKSRPVLSARVGNLVGIAAGAAIAVALVPPLSVVGVCLAHGWVVAAMESYWLFMVNYFGIAFGAYVVFYLRSWRLRDGRSVQKILRFVPLPSFATFAISTTLLCSMVAMLALFGSDVAAGAQRDNPSLRFVLDYVNGVKSSTICVVRNGRTRSWEPGNPIHEGDEFDIDLGLREDPHLAFQVDNAFVTNLTFVPRGRIRRMVLDGRAVDNRARLYELANVVREEISLLRTGVTRDHADRLTARMKKLDLPVPVFHTDD